jgi:hypothetical protein
MSIYKFVVGHVHYSLRFCPALVNSLTGLSRYARNINVLVRVTKKRTVGLYSAISCEFIPRRLIKLNTVH